jgi:hypothetical protein
MDNDTHSVCVFHNLVNNCRQVWAQYIEYCNNIAISIYCTIQQYDVSSQYNNNIVRPILQ